jgi:hypothetical protein
MYARTVEDASAHLHALRHEEIQDLVLAAVALGSAVAATQFLPALALPLFIGGLAIGGLGVRALWRRWDLVDRLAGEPDAYVISEVHEYALRETTMERRHTFAALIRNSLDDRGHDCRTTTAEATELEGLAADLENEELELDPACAVACLRLLSDPTESPLLDPILPRDSLLARIRQIRSGFTPRRLAA